MNILHFNDTYEVERTPAFIEQFLELSNENTLRLFSGDILNPSFVSMTKKGRQFIPFLKKVNLHAAVIGNHELDLGFENFNQIQEEVQVNWLLCNYIHKKTKKTLLDHPSYDIQYMNGFKIGLFGLIDQEWVDTCGQFTVDYQLLDPFEKAREMCSLLKSENCDLIIALTHCATDTDLKILKDDSIAVDFILGGHQHVFLVEKYKNKLMVKSGFDFWTFSNIQIARTDKKTEKFNAQDGTLIDESDKIPKTINFLMEKQNKEENILFNVSISRIVVDFKGKFNAEFQNYIELLTHEIIENSQTPMAVFSDGMDLTTKLIRANDSKFLNLTTDLVRINKKTDLGFIVSGHVRAETVYSDNYIFRELNLIKSFPNASYLRLVYCKGKDFIQILEQGLQHCPNPKGSHPNVSGLTANYDTDKKSFDRIDLSSLQVHEKPIDYEKTYSVVTLCFLSVGGDGYTKMKDCEVKDDHSHDTCRTVFKKFFQLPMNINFREEFLLVHDKICKYSLDDLIKHSKWKDQENRVVEILTVEFLAERNNDILKILTEVSIECTQRICMYRLVRGIVEIEGRYVFSIDNELDCRLKKIRKENIDLV